MWSYARRGARVPSLKGAGSREPGAGSSTQPCDWSGVLYTVGLVDAPRLMPIRPRLTRPPRILIARSEEHTSELQSRLHLVCRLLLEKKKKKSRTSKLCTRQSRLQRSMAYYLN